MKLTLLEKAIAEIDSEIATLRAARQRLVDQQAKQPKRKQAAKHQAADDMRDVVAPDPRD